MNPKNKTLIELIKKSFLSEEIKNYLLANLGKFNNFQITEMIKIFTREVNAMEKIKKKNLIKEISIFRNLKEALKNKEEKIFQVITKTIEEKDKKQENREINKILNSLKNEK